MPLAPRRDLAAGLLSAHLLMSGHPAIVVRRSIDDAQRRLATPACQAVLDDFTTPAGGTLRSVLDALDQEPGAYLATLRFAPGDEHGQCRGPRATTAFTVPGSRVIFVCAERFAKAFANNKAHGAGLIIHEMLHSLGLGEDPPSSAVITARVRERCGE